MHLRHDNTLDQDELPAEAKAKLAQYFIDNMRDGISLVFVELVGPNEDRLPVVAHSPNSPICPLPARRKSDEDEHAISPIFLTPH